MKELRNKNKPHQTFAVTCQLDVDRVQENFVVVDKFWFFIVKFFTMAEFWTHHYDV